MRSHNSNCLRTHTHIYTHAYTYKYILSLDDKDHNGGNPKQDAGVGSGARHFGSSFKKLLS